MKNEQPTTGEGRALASTFLLAACSVILFALVLNLTVAHDSWTHDFFFRRRFVQWVLLMAFAVGFIHLMRRIPIWLKEQKDLNAISKGRPPYSPDTMVGRRWAQIKASERESGREDLGQYAKHLAEHDEAELDGGYRVPGDIVQILPLIGFFGTVFGLSIGLYNSFLREGGATTKAFAHSIAIAFDNTLLGLALTIILFIFLSIFRKREEAILLRLDLLAHDEAAAGQSAVERPEEAIKTSVNLIVGHLDRLQKLFETPTNKLKEMVRLHATEIATSVVNSVSDQQKVNNEELNKLVVERLDELQKVFEAPTNELRELVKLQATETANTVANKLADQQKEKHEELNKLVSVRLNELATMLSKTVSEKTSALLATDGPFWTEMTGANKKLDVIGKAATEISIGIAALPKTDQQAHFKELIALIEGLALALSTRHSETLEKLGAAEEAKKELSVLASETHNLADRVSSVATKVEALPEERRQIQMLGSVIKELAVALGQRDLLMLEKIDGLIESRSNDLKSETAKLFSQPRTFTLVEAVGEPGGDGSKSKL